MSFFLLPPAFVPGSRAKVECEGYKGSRDVEARPYADS